jgi:hypothetical protein
MSTENKNRKRTRPEKGAKYRGQLLTRASQRPSGGFPFLPAAPDGKLSHQNTGIPNTERRPSRIRRSIRLQDVRQAKAERLLSRSKAGGGSITQVRI